MSRQAHSKLLAHFLSRVPLYTSLCPLAHLVLIVFCFALLWFLVQSYVTQLALNHLPSCPAMIFQVLGLQVCVTMLRGKCPSLQIVPPPECCSKTF